MRPPHPGVAALLASQRMVVLGQAGLEIRTVAGTETNPQGSTAAHSGGARRTRARRDKTPEDILRAAVGMVEAAVAVQPQDGVEAHYCERVEKN